MTTPFELRLDVLKMARDLVIDEFYHDRDMKLEAWRVRCSNAERTGSNAPDMPSMPPFPSEVKILDKAKSLNLFISRTST